MELIKDETFSSIFWRLSNENINKRESAVIELIKYIENLQEADGPMYRKYTVERLVKGLRSIRNLARVGFAAALTSLLIHFTSHIDQEELLDIIKKHLYETKPESKGEGTGLKIGQLYLLSALQKANCFSKCTSEQVKWLTAPICPLLEKKDYKPLAFYTINAVLSQITSEAFEEALLPSLSKFLSAGWDNTDPNEILLLITASQKHSSIIGKKWLSTHWGKKHLFSSSNTSSFLNLMERSFEGRERALTTSHPLVKSVVEAIKEDDDTLTALWQAAVQRVFAESENQTKSIQSKAVLLQLFFNIIQISQQSEKLKVLQPSERAVLLFHKQLTKTELALFPMASSFVQNQFPRWCQQVDNECQGALFSILTTANPTFDLGLVPGLRVSQVLVGKVGDSDRLMAYAESLCQAYEEKDSRLEKCAYIANQLRLLIVSGECLPPKYILSILVFMLDCVRENPKQNDPMVSAFYKCLDWLSSAPRRLIKPSHYFRRIMKPLLKHGIEKLSESGDKNELIVASLQKASSLIGKKEENEEVTADNHTKQMFALLYAHLGFHSLADGRGMEALLKDVDQCYEKAIAGDVASPLKKKKKKSTEDEDEGPHWTEVMSDCLLSLLSHGSRLLRGLVRLVFSRMVDYLTPTCGQLLADVLLSRIKQGKGLDEEDEDLLNFDSDEGENEEDEEDEDEEEEGMDVGEDDEKEHEEEEEEDEEEDEDDDDEDEEEMDEDEDAMEIAALRQRMQTALGSAGMSTEVSDDSDMDDDAMFRLDKAIAEAFKATCKANSCSKKAMEARRQQLIQMKSKCLDLVEIVLQQSNSVSVIMPCVSACVQVLGRPDEGELRVADTVAVIKKRQKALVAKEDEVEQVYKAIVGHIHAANKAQPLPKFLSVLASVIIFLLKSLPEKSQRKLIKEELRKFMEENSALSLSLISILFERNPLLGWHVREHLMNWARREDIKLFNRTQAVTIMCTVLKFTSQVENQGAFRALCLSTADQLLKDTDIWSHPHLARQIMELAFGCLKGEQLDKDVISSLSQTVNDHLSTKGNSNKTILRGLRRLNGILQQKPRNNKGKKRKNRKRKLSESK